jgi:hypothetical protein
MGTDGKDWIHLSRDVDWKALVEPTQSSKFFLRDDPTNFSLIAGFVPAGSTSVTQAMILHYHHSHVKADGRLKVTGPVRWSGNALGRSFVGGRFRLFTGRADGVLYLEDEGITRPATDGGFDFDMELSERYLGGVGRRARLMRAWVAHTAGAADQTITTRLSSRSAGAPASEFFQAPIAIPRREASSLLANATAEAHTLRVQNTDSLGSFGITAYHFEVHDGGVTP